MIRSRNFFQPKARVIDLEVFEHFTLLTALIIPPLLARIRAEERLLRTQFDGEYDTYCARTSRLIPLLY